MRQSFSTLRASIDIPEHIAIRMKFDNELDEYIIDNLAKQFISELVKHKHIKPTMLRLPYDQTIGPPQLRYNAELYLTTPPSLM